MVEHKSEMKIYFIEIVRIPTPATPKVALLQGLKKSVFGVVCSFGCGIKILRIVKKKKKKKKKKNH